MMHCMQLAQKVWHYCTYVDAVSFDNIADVPSELRSQRQQLIKFEETFEVGHILG